MADRRLCCCNEQLRCVVAKDDLEGFELELIPGGSINIKDNTYPFIFGGQFMSIPENSSIELELDVEVLASEKQDGTPLQKSLRWGIYVAFRGRSDFVKYYLQNFAMEHRIITDSSGEYSIMYRPTHLIGLELGISVASAGLLGVPTGTPSSYVADVVAVAKKDLKPGDVLDGEGGYTVYGQLTTAEQSLDGRYLPIGLSNKAKLLRQMSKDSIITYDDVKLDENGFLYRVRKKIEERSRRKK